VVAAVVELLSGEFFEQTSSSLSPIVGENVIAPLGFGQRAGKEAFAKGMLTHQVCGELQGIDKGDGLDAVDVGGGLGKGELLV
jgi:hypothetical protein